MTVKELIQHLHTFPEDLPIVYACCSEYTTLEAHEIGVIQLQPARKDGWVASQWSGEPKVKTIPILAFPGN